VESKSLVIGCITGYEYEQVEPWIVSLEQTGYQGQTALVVYEGSKDLIEKLEKKNVHVLAFARREDGGVTHPNAGNPGFSIMVERFAHMWYFLQSIPEFKDIEAVLTTDVRDVIFQVSPDAMLYGTNDIVVGSEGFKYNVEPWSKANMQQAFGPMVYETMKNRDIICAGVIGGPTQAIMDLFLQVFLLCRGTAAHVPGGGGPDQAALNILLHGSGWIDNTWNSEFILHAGTSIPGIQAGNGDIGLNYKQTPEILDYYKENFMRSDYPKLIDDEIICGLSNDKYHIVHQYNRIPEWNEVLNKKYRD
jgi:hypothetical protein